MGPPTSRIVVVKSMSSLFGQLLFPKYPWIRLRREAPRRMEFHDESSDVSSLGRSASADVTRSPA